MPKGGKNDFLEWTPWKSYPSDAWNKGDLEGGVCCWGRLDRLGPESQNMFKIWGSQTGAQKCLIGMSFTHVVTRSCSHHFFKLGGWESQSLNMNSKQPKGAF